MGPPIVLPNMFQRILFLGQRAGAQLQLLSQLLALSTSLRKNSNRLPRNGIGPRFDRGADKPSLEVAEFSRDVVGDQPALWEGYIRFEQVCEILREKYGGRV